VSLSPSPSVIVLLLGVDRLHLIAGAVAERDYGMRKANHVLIGVVGVAEFHHVPVTVAKGDYVQREDFSKSTT
jgi:hypothetical protein